MLGSRRNVHLLHNNEGGIWIRWFGHVESNINLLSRGLSVGEGYIELFCLSKFNLEVLVVFSNWLINIAINEIHSVVILLKVIVDDVSETDINVELQLVLSYEVNDSLASFNITLRRAVDVYLSGTSGYVHLLDDDK